MFAPMTAAKIYKEILTGIELMYDKQEAAAIASILFEHKTGISKFGIIREPGKPVSEETIAELRQALSQLQQHIPIQYITGEAWFYGLKLQVSPAVLIPRPETEELVHAVIQSAKSNSNLNILDIGTGSGCIPIALSRHIPGAHITAIDVSAAALATAKTNAVSLDAAVNFSEMDFLDETNWHQLGRYDIITSNPPYIPMDEKLLLDKHVTESEPHIALFVPEQKPLLFYEKIALFGKQHLNETGKLFMETHEQYAREVAALFDGEHYSAEVIIDLNGNERIVIATRRCR